MIITLKRSRVFVALITVGMVFAPFTALRVANIGVTEIVILILALFLIFGSWRVALMSSRHFMFTRFWILFLTLNTLGFLNNYLIQGHTSGQFSSMLFDTSAYVFVFFTCLVFESFLYMYPLIDLNRCLRNIYLSSSIVLLILFLISRNTDAFLGMPLTYYGMFRPMATNVHHVAMFVLPLPFIGLKLAYMSRNIFCKALFFVLVASNVLVAISTGPFKVILGLALGFAVFSWIQISRVFIRSRGMRDFLAIAILVIVLPIAFTYGKDMAAYAISNFRLEDLGGGRETLYVSAVNKSLSGFLLGFGPGAHAALADGTYADAHQSFLTVLLQGGLLALIAYLVLWVKIMLRCRYDVFLVAAQFSIFVYVLGGDVLRRLPVWILLMLLFYICTYAKQNVSKIG